MYFKINIVQREDNRYKVKLPLVLKNTIINHYSQFKKPHAAMNLVIKIGFKNS